MINSSNETKVEPIDSFFDIRASSYNEHREKNVSSYPDLYIALGRNILRTDKVVKVLDLGSGTGLELKWLFEKMPNMNVRCVDISRKMLEELKNEYTTFESQIEIIKDSYLDFRFDEESYDFVVSVMSFHHLLKNERLDLYKRIYQSLKQDGVFIEGDYVVKSLQEEFAHIKKAQKILKEHGLSNIFDYHIDIPLSEKSQTDLYSKAGFTSISQKYNEDEAILFFCKC